jgi:GntR family transcriptional regulator/MocR family aminotransferase
MPLTCGNIKLRDSNPDLTALLPRGRHLSTRAVHRADSSGIAVNSLSAFYANRAPQSGLVLGYGAIPLPKIEEGLRLLRRVLSL